MTEPDEIDLEVRRLLADLREQQRQLEETQAELRATTFVGSAERGLVTVVVDGGGRIGEVTIDPDAPRIFSADDLGRVVLSAIHDAMGQLAEATKERFAPFVPDESVLERSTSYWDPGLTQDPTLRR